MEVKRLMFFVELPPIVKSELFVDMEPFDSMLILFPTLNIGLEAFIFVKANLAEEVEVPPSKRSIVLFVIVINPLSSL